MKIKSGNTAKAYKLIEYQSASIKQINRAKRGPPIVIVASVFVSKALLNRAATVVTTDIPLLIRKILVIKSIVGVSLNNIFYKK